MCVCGGGCYEREGRGVGVGVRICGFVDLYVSMLTCVYVWISVCVCVG